MLGAEELGDSFTFGICGNWKLAVLESTGRMTGDELPESVPEPVVGQRRSLKYCHGKLTLEDAFFDRGQYLGTLLLTSNDTSSGH